MNTLCQGSAADLVKKAMISIDKKLPLGSYMLMQIHDELLFEVPEMEVPSVQVTFELALFLS